MPGTRTLRGTYAGTTDGRVNRDLESAPTTPAKPTEGGRPTARRGRPKGSKNKPKGLVPGMTLDKLLPDLRTQLSPESFEYVEGVLKKGRPIETKRELDVMIAMLARNLITALTEETLELSSAGFRKDITERLKILNSMLTLRHQIEKNSDDGDKPGNSILIKLGERLDAGRIGVLVGIQPDGVVGTADRTGRQTVSAGAVPDQLPERPLLGEGGEQV